MRRSEIQSIRKHLGPTAMALGALVLASTSAQALMPQFLSVPGLMLIGGREDLRAAQEEFRQYQQRERSQAADYERRDALERQRVRDQMSKDAEEQRRAEAEAERQRAETYRKWADEQKQEADRKRAAKQQAEDNRRADAERRMAADLERQRLEQEAMSERMATAKRERARPENILSRAYANYIGVRRCQASRTGKAFVYVDDQEGADAKAQVKDIETRIMQANPAMNREGLWARATQTDDIMWTISRSDIENGEFIENGQIYCRQALAGIRQQYVDLNPEAGIVKKDF